jgi:hypothetical protein
MLAYYLTKGLLFVFKSNFVEIFKLILQFVIWKLFLYTQFFFLAC